MQGQEERQYDLYYQGSKDQLYSFLYPLTGSHSPIFDHLQQQQMIFDPNTQKFEVKYATKDFQNIGGGKKEQEISYSSTSISSQSNYFYSTYLPQVQSFVWRNVSNFVEMRPTPVNTSEKKQGEEANKVLLNIVQYDHEQNKAKRQIEMAPEEPIKPNHEICKAIYLEHFSK